MNERLSDVEDPHLLPDEIKWAIVFAKKRNESNRKVAKEVGAAYNRPTLSKDSVKAVYEKYLEKNSVDNQWSSQGRPQLLDSDQIDEVVDHCLDDRRKSVRQHSIELQIQASRQTVNRALINRGYRAYRARKKPLLRAKNIIKRYKFSQAHEDLDAEDWKMVVFTDECTFKLINSDGRTLIRRTAGEAIQDDTVQSHASISRSIMVWGAISTDGLGPLVRVPSSSSLNGEGYLDILRYRLKKFYPGLFDGSLMLQHDNAPCHTAGLVQGWLEARNISRLQWPPQSPDLNIIENVWNMIKYQMRGKVYQDEEELWKMVQRCWKKISWEAINRLYESMPRRIIALKEARGKHIKY